MSGPPVRVRGAASRRRNRRTGTPSPAHLLGLRSGSQTTRRVSPSSVSRGPYAVGAQQHRHQPLAPLSAATTASALGRLAIRTPTCSTLVDPSARWSADDGSTLSSLRRWSRARSWNGSTRRPGVRSACSSSTRARDIRASSGAPGRCGPAAAASRSLLARCSGVRVVRPAPVITRAGLVPRPSASPARSPRARRPPGLVQLGGPRAPRVMGNGPRSRGCRFAQADPRSAMWSVVAFPPTTEPEVAGLQRRLVDVRAGAARRMGRTGPERRGRRPPRPRAGSAGARCRPASRGGPGSANPPVEHPVVDRELAHVNRPAPARHATQPSPMQESPLALARQQGFAVVELAEEVRLLRAPQLDGVEHAGTRAAGSARHRLLGAPESATTPAAPRTDQLFRACRAASRRRSLGCRR